MKNLVIVESPTKAKTISKFLGRNYKVLSSFGHVRDLPKNDLGVDVDHDFAPRYVVPTKAKKVASELKKAAQTADTVYFASDEDREGEAISWHLEQLLGVDPEKMKRISFHEITASAIKDALEHPRSIDIHLVDAQQARRVLDRLVGYKLSPFLWRKVARGLSAGRVQSAVVRLIVEREREINDFKTQEYWTVEALLQKQTGAQFNAKLQAKDGETLDKFALPDETTAQTVVSQLAAAQWSVGKLERKTVHKKPHPPFTTSTLQQEANNRLGFSSKQTMALAQQLYEGVELGGRGQIGLITYMRTDSVNLAEKFLTETREWLNKNLPVDAAGNESRRYQTKAKGAQEAHEAIRPTDVSLHPDMTAEFLDARQQKLYELIWRRAVASQMADAETETVTADIDATSANQPHYTFRATGSTLLKKGFLEIYTTETNENLLPELSLEEKLIAAAIEPKQHFTEPPPRYTEASLVKTLEENGIGRPSTYAPTISTVTERGYVEKDGRKLKPTDLANLVNDLLVKHFPNIVDLEFTAKMENELDDIAAGEKEWVPIIRDFYEPFAINLANKEMEIKKKDIVEEKTDAVCEKCGAPMVIKMGRFGKFLACSGFPNCRNTKNIGEDGQVEEKDTSTETIDEKCEKCGAPMMLKHGRFGAFLSCSRYPECKTIKSIQKKVGVKCPACGQGDLVEKRTRKGGKAFFSCSRYPTCDFALWERPTGDTCPKCNSLLVSGRGKEKAIHCSNQNCDYKEAKTED